MRNMDDVMTILPKGNNHEKINKQIEILRQHLKTFSKFIYGEGRSNFSDDVIKEDHEMRTIDDTMTLSYKQNHKKINKLKNYIF